jgi:hypothetical protein
MSNGHGAIPPEENLRLYMEYHAMCTVAGELIDSQQPVRIDTWDETADPWHDWLCQFLPAYPTVWVADRRSAVPADADLFGHLPPIDEWDSAADTEYDRAFGLTGGNLSALVLVAGYTDLQRPGAYGVTSIRSALVAPAHANELQRALASASDPRHWKLPDEDEEDFEVGHDEFVLKGWLADPTFGHDTLDRHDPYAQGLQRMLPLPGSRFREATGATIDRTRLALYGPAGILIARADQWADPDPDGREAVTSSGNRVYVARETLLHYLADTGMALIVEVQIGRHRRNGIGGYRTPRSRVYLVDSTGHVTHS